MLIFPLKKEWYEKIKSGEKTVEYREVKPYWTKRLLHEKYNDYSAARYSRKIYSILKRYSEPCFFRLGYTKEILKAWITKIEIVDGKDTDLRIDKPVYAIHITNVTEVKQ